MTNHEVNKVMEPISITRICYDIAPKMSIRSDFRKIGSSEVEVYLCNCTINEYMNEPTKLFNNNYIGKGIIINLGFTGANTFLYNIIVAHPKEFDKSIKDFYWYPDIVADVANKKLFLFRTEEKKGT